MPNSKRETKPKLGIKADKPAKTRVEEMFGGVGYVSQDGPVMKVDAEIPLPEHADPEPDQPSVRDIKDRVEGLFRSIGTAALPDTVFPSGTRNNGPQAAEFVVAEQLKKLAEKRYEEAKKNGKDAGCFGDETKYVAGETVEVYRTPHFTFSVQRNQDSNMIDRKAVEDLLREIAPTKWQELLKRCEKPKAGATRFIVALR
jgi:hypothetical protein